MGIFIGMPGGMVVADWGIKGLASRISATLVLKRNASKGKVSPLWLCNPLARRGCRSAGSVGG